MTIDALARRAGCTTRTVRNHQTAGLLPPPILHGRVGWYDSGHLARLRLIARLQRQGFSLAGIREMLRAWQDGRSLADVLGFEEALTAPWVEEAPEVLTAGELFERFPEAVEDATLISRALELGLIEPQEDGDFRLPSPALVRAGAELVSLGIPLAEALDQAAALKTDMDRVAERFVGLFEQYVLIPFVEAGMPGDQLPRVTDALQRMRPLAASSVRAALGQAMERRAEASQVVKEVSE